MKVILLERVGRTGSIGDEVSVKDGFARNFLLPQGKALRATEANRKKFEAERAHIEQRNEERRNAAAGIAEGLNCRTVTTQEPQGSLHPAQHRGFPGCRCRNGTPDAHQ